MAKHQTDKFKQMEDRLARLELSVQSCPQITRQAEANTRYGRGDYGQPMAPETEKGMGAAA